MGKCSCHLFLLSANLHCKGVLFTNIDCDFLHSPATKLLVLNLTYMEVNMSHLRMNSNSELIFFP